MARLFWTRANHYLKRITSTVSKAFTRFVLSGEFLSGMAWLSKLQVRFVLRALPQIREIRDYFFKRETSLTRKITGGLVVPILFFGYAISSFFLLGLASFGQFMVLIIRGRNILFRTDEVAKKTDKWEEDKIEMLKITKKTPSLMLSYQRRLEARLKKEQEKLDKVNSELENRNYLVRLREIDLDQQEEKQKIKQERLYLEEERISLRESQQPNNSNQMLEVTERLKQLKLKEDIMQKQIANKEKDESRRRKLYYDNFFSESLEAQRRGGDYN
ncbi:hypothetical protein ACE193_09375 [Bernardetia sp. OM2101]|uniref:hypothetical protein n=1 Tax=Bernardetia sp. OM2101 TaxID=3344876 RepID=UPI0035D04D42